MMNLDALEILNELRAQGAMPVLENDKLQIKKPTHVKIDETLIERLNENKIAIIDFLNSQERTTETERIEVVDRSMSRIPLSYSQERIWSINRFEGSAFHHIPSLRKLTGSLKISTLQKAFTNVINRHEILRTIYCNHKGKPYQEITEKKDWSFDVLDFSRASYPEIMDFISRETYRPFKLDQEPSFRAILIKSGTDCYYFSLVLHHIAADEWSIPVFYDDLIQNYDALLTDSIPDLPELKIQYVDYALWKRKKWNRANPNKKLIYWQKKLSGCEPLKLNTDFPRTAVRSTRSSTIHYLIQKEISDKITLQCEKNGFSLFMYLLAAYKILLHKSTEQRDLVVGSSIANRQHGDIAPLIGSFANTVPMRSIMDPSISFADFLTEIKETTLGAFQNQDVPIEKIIEKVEDINDISQSTLIRSTFVLQNTPEGNVKEMTDIKLEDVRTATASSKLELSLKVLPGMEGFRVSAVYHVDLFQKVTVLRMVKHLEDILQTVVMYPDIVIDDIPFSGDKEKEEVIADVPKPAGIAPL